MAATLAQIIGVEQGVRASTEQWWKLVRDSLHKEQLLVGISQTYEPEEGNLPQPDKTQRVQLNVVQLLGEARKRFSRYFDVTASKDWGNTGTDGARADVVHDGQVILHDVPATFLLFLEKRLAELAADIKKIPTQSAAEQWDLSTEPGIWRTPEATSHSTRRIEHFEVIGQTKEHPGQLVKQPEDVISGRWRTVKFTSAPTVAWQEYTLERIAMLREAVQNAIYDANKIEVRDQHVAAPVFDFIFPVDRS
jgi:hypothetical protein